MLVFLFPCGLPLFFLVAGAGSRFALRRRSGAQYAKERVYRLLIPFIVGSLFVTLGLAEIVRRIPLLRVLFGIKTPTGV